MCTTSNEKNKTTKNLIYANIWWHFGSKQVKGKHIDRITGKGKEKTTCIFIQKLIKLPTITSNKYNGMEQDELVQYGNYNQPWKLNSATSEHYYDKNTGVRNRQENQHDIKVQVVDEKNMDQVQIKNTADVQTLPHKPKPLLSCGKIVKQVHTIILDDLIATIIDKDTNEMVMKQYLINEQTNAIFIPMDPCHMISKKNKKSIHLD